MKHSILTLIALAFLPLVSCDEQNASNESNYNAIETQKEEVDTAARDAIRQTEINAEFDEAKLEAQRVAALEQLEARQKKAEAEVVAEQARIEADKTAAQAQLDANKAKAEAEAEAARLKTD